MLENFSWLILVPVWVSALIMGARFLGVSFSKKIIVILSIAATLFSALYSGYGLYYTTCYSPVEVSFPFITIGHFNLNLGVYVDMLNSLTGLAVSIITLCIYVYSVFYMDTEKSFSRYYSLMNLFNTTILAFIFSPNLFQMLMFWECIGAVSYLLIGFWYTKPIVSADAKRVFLVNIIGDIALFAGVVIVSNLVVATTGNVTLASLPFSDLNLITSSLFASTTPTMYTCTALLFVVAAFVKSAQFPINSWLINAMSAPTPVSALIHSSTLVMTGVFLLMRIFPVIAMDSFCLKLLISIGLITALITSIAAVVQKNIKKVLAYSTSAQLGLVFLALGCYSPVAGIVYLISHAFIKSLLFMCAGVVIKLVNNKNILFMGQLRQCVPITALCFIVGAAALSGIGFCGFSAKHILTNTFCCSKGAYIIFGLIGALTSLYIFRLYFLVFENTRPAVCPEKEVCYSRFALPVLIFMSAAVIGLTFVLPAGKLCPLYILNFGMIIAAYFIYGRGLKLPKIPILHTIVLNGFFVNKIYSWGEDIVYRWASNIARFIETYIIGGIEWVLKNSSIFTSEVFHKMQSNNIQSYVSYSVWVFLIITTMFVGLYMLILNIFGV